MSASRGTSLYLNLGHALDHLLMLIFPTVVLAMGEELGRGYAELLPLSLGGFIAFGVCSVPAGWLADRENVGRVLGVNGVFGNVGVAFSALPNPSRARRVAGVCLVDRCIDTS